MSPFSMCNVEVEGERADSEKMAVTTGQDVLFPHVGVFLRSELWQIDY